MAKRLFQEIERLKTQILSLSALAEDSVYNAVKSVLERDQILARKVLDGDKEIDLMEVEIEEECLKLLALHQPVALDLRYIVAVLKINNDLERIGDLASNIAQRSVILRTLPESDIPFDFEKMGERVKTMLRKCLSALVNLDRKTAEEVLASDDEVDLIHREVYARVCQTVQESPKNAEILVNLLSVSRNLERIADHATNIAEDVIYLIEGEIIRHGRGVINQK